MSLLKTNEIQNYNGSSLTLTASTVSTSAQLNTGGNISVTGSLNVSDDSTTRTNLGLGTIATQDSDSITVTGGTATLGALTVSGSDSGDLVRITQTGSGNALVVEDSANPDSTPFVVDAAGRLLVGHDSSVDTRNYLNNNLGGPTFQQHGTTQGSSNAGIYSWVNNSFAPSSLVLNKSISGTIGTRGALTAINTDIGAIVFAGDDGTNFIPAAAILAKVDGTPGTNDMPGSLVFSTTADGASSPTERMRIDSSGAITMPAVYSDTVTGRDLYISSSGQLGYVSSIRSSKTNIENLPSISWLYELTPVKFQYRIKDGDDNYTDEAEPEIQYGFIAEDVVEVNSDLVFGDETENGFELRGIQYSRLIAPMIKAIQEQKTLIESQQSQIDALTARIEALETT